MLYRVLGLLSLCIVLHIIQADDCAAGNCFAFLCFGTHAIVLVAGVRLLGQAACLNRNGGGFFIDPCRTSIGFSILYFTCYHMLYRVLGFLSLCFVLIPLCLKGHIAARHCEFFASIKLGFAVDGFAIHFPADKGEACALELSGFTTLYRVKESLVNLIRFATIPGAAIQIICHRTTGNILCVVICRSVHRLRHKNRTIGKGRIGIPTLECVGYTALIFCPRECFIRHIRRFGFFTGDVVLAAQKFWRIISYILQIILYRGNLFTHDLNITVDMVIRV